MHSISASQLNCYLGCSLQYKFRYVDKLPKPWRSAGMAFGTSIHAAIEWFHRERMAGRVPLASAAVAIFQADWYAQTVEPLIFGKNETKELLAEKGAEMIRVYIEAAATAPVPSAVEERFSVALVDVETGEEIGVDLHGIIDLVESDGTVVDFKTSARAFDVVGLERHLQLSIYALPEVANRRVAEDEDAAARAVRDRAERGRSGLDRTARGRRGAVNRSGVVLSESFVEMFRVRVLRTLQSLAGEIVLSCFKWSPKIT
jgi:putative RecB family exonuclease